ncbi:MAG: CocE/NonD family hydrolase [Planctomycetes bacterium]|nr:CocE/NonD family hydrolase [Planctomycetota bacterium]
MHKLIALASLTFCFSLATAQDAPEAPWKVEHRDMQVPMRDGKTLAANILLPKKQGKYPCILVQTPYDKNRLGREYGDKSSEGGRGSEKAFAQFDRDNFAYAFVDWRGFYGSKAAMQGVQRGKWKRGQDGYDCVEWIAKQDWCNGKVGTWGGSALGKQQFDTAAEQPPHLVCCAPLIAYQGNRYEAYYEGGVALEAHVKSLDRLGFGVGELVAANPLPNRLWQFVRSTSYKPDKIAVPCLMVSGWWDNYPREVVEQFEDLLAKGTAGAKESKLVMGPWSHTAIDVPNQGDQMFKDAEDYSTKITKQFFDFYLREIKDSGWEKQPRVHAYQCGEGWATGESWAKLRGKAVAMHLHADGKVDASAPAEPTTEAPLTRQYTYDPKKPSPTIGGQNLPPLDHGPKELSVLEKRADVLAYTTAALDKPLRVRGEIELTVPLSCNRVDTDIHVRLCDTDESGKTYLVGETIQRAKLRDGKATQALKPGEVYELTLQFAPHAYTWAKGHKLKLIITGGNSPRYERNTHTGADAWDEAKALDVAVTIYHDAKRAPKLTLPVIE